MQIRIRETGQVMYEDEFRTYVKTNNGPTWIQTSEEILNSLGADVVFEGPQATGGTRYQFSQASGVEEIGGKWFTKYILGPTFTNIPATSTEPAKTAAEQEAAYILQCDNNQAASIRATRDTKLASCDWTQVADSPVSKTQWATYRRALRDLPAQSGFPWEVIWPTTP